MDFPLYLRVKLYSNVSPLSLTEEELELKIQVWLEYRTDRLLFVLARLTLICLFSSRSLCTSICSRLHSSMIFFTSPSSSEALADLGRTECSVLTEAEEDTGLMLSLSCCGESGGEGGEWSVGWEWKKEKKKGTRGWRDVHRHSMEIKVEINHVMGDTVKCIWWYETDKILNKRGKKSIPALKLIKILWSDFVLWKGPIGLVFSSIF